MPKDSAAGKKLDPSRPAWLKVRTADASLFIPIKKIGDGEREALALALELKADVVLIDDKDAAAELQRHSILTIPTFAILERAAARNLIDLPKTVDAMRRTSFRLPPEEVVEAMLKRDRQRKESEPRDQNPEV